VHDVTLIQHIPTTWGRSLFHTEWRHCHPKYWLRGGGLLFGPLCMWPNTQML